MASGDNRVGRWPLVPSGCEPRPSRAACCAANGWERRDVVVGCRCHLESIASIRVRHHFRGISQSLQDGDVCGGPKLKIAGVLLQGCIPFCTPSSRRFGSCESDHHEFA